MRADVSSHLGDGAVLVQIASATEADLIATMRSIARQLGEPLTLARGDAVERLIPRTAIEATPNSLSGRFGRGAFPLHTDLAHRLTPPRFMILGAAEVEPRAARTVVTAAPELRSRERSVVRDGVFLVSNGGRSFYSSILGAGRPFIRFDTACMRPTDAHATEAERVFRECLKQEESVEITWQSGDILVLDNWNVLHGRTEPESKTAKRVLLRLYGVEKR
jgi:alpha-ketoglutarate-dependent taurine dioxygenase